MAFPDEGRILIAFQADTLVWLPTTDWTAIDLEYPNLVTSYTIDRGRQYELDTTDTGRAVIEIMDPDGTLDPTNSASPFFISGSTRINPLKQVIIRRYNPKADDWNHRFRGFIEELDYSLHPTQKVYALTISCVDLFEILSAIQMFPYDPDVPGTGGFGDDPSDGGESFLNDVKGQVWFGPVVDGDPYVGSNIDDRLNRILDQAGIPDDFRIIFSGNVVVQEASYSPGESCMSALQETSDAEFPGVSNLFVDRFGRLAWHGRVAKFDPSAIVGDPEFYGPNWDYHAWKAGDGGWVLSSPGTYAQIRDFSFNRGLSKIINHAIATPKNIPDEDVNGQVVVDTASIGHYGFRSWSAQNLLTKSRLESPTLPAADWLEETRNFAAYYVGNYAHPANRIGALTFRSVDPDTPGSSENWRLLSRADIADSIEIYVDAPSSGGFEADDYFIEGIHEECRPANPDYDDVTMTLDLSPRAYFNGFNPWEAVE